MTDNRMSGIALIAGTVGMIITMTLHPTGGHIPPDRLEAMLRMLIIVHALALACLPVQFLGTWGLSRNIAAPNRLSIAALVVYTFALLAVMNAAVADGLISPGIFRQALAPGATPSAADTWRMISRYNFFVNQGFAQVYVVGSSVAIFLWSLSMWWDKKLSRGLGIYGCILGAVTLPALFSGRLNLDAHGFGMVVFSQALWYVSAGSILFRDDQQPVSAGHL